MIVSQKMRHYHIIYHAVQRRGINGNVRYDGLQLPSLCKREYPALPPLGIMAAYFGTQARSPVVFVCPALPIRISTRNHQRRGRTLTHQIFNKHLPNL